MPELMRRHVNADVPRDGIDDLYGERFLALVNAFFGDEEGAVHVGAKARQDMTTIPSKTAGHLVRNLPNNVLPLRFCVPGGNVKEQLAPRTSWLAEVRTPIQGTQVLRPQR